MTNDQLMELLGIADQIENGGGWHIAALKIRAFVGEHKMQSETLEATQKALRKAITVNWENDLLEVCEDEEKQILALAYQPSVPNPISEPK
jgi:hypothetical protein